MDPKYKEQMEWLCEKLRAAKEATTIGTIREFCLAAGAVFEQLRIMVKEELEREERLNEGSDI